MYYVKNKSHLLTFSMLLRDDCFGNEPLNTSQIKHPKPHISVELRLKI